MPSASNDDQFKFLISCIRCSNNGKVGFGQVAQEYKIVSKSAAAKRYERMMKAHGIARNAKASKPSSARSNKSDRNSPSEKVLKKRKTDAFIEDSGDTDDDEIFNNRIKSDPVNKKEKFMAKKEEHARGQQLSMKDATKLMHFCDTPSYNGSSSYSSGPGDEQGLGVDGGGDVFGNATSVGDDYVLHLQPFDFNAAYGDGNFYSTSRGSAQNCGTKYPAMMQPPPSRQGRSENPVIVE